MKAPCYDCLDRRVGCHSICPSYKVFQAEQDAMNRQRIQKELADQYCIEGVKRVQRDLYKSYDRKGRKRY